MPTNIKAPHKCGAGVRALVHEGHATKATLGIEVQVGFDPMLEASLVDRDDLTFEVPRLAGSVLDPHRLDDETESLSLAVVPEFDLDRFAVDEFDEGSREKALAGTAAECHLLGV